MRSLLRAARRLPLWPYLPGRVKSLAVALSNPALHVKHIQIEPTRLCNLRCIMCARTHLGSDSKPNLTLDAFKRLIDQIPTLEIVSLNGTGEPFLNRQLMDMVEYARSKGLYTRFNTNFSVVNDEIIERLVTSGHSEITISMESNDPDTFADVRRGTTLATVMGRLQKLLDARRLHNSKTPKILVYSILMKCVLPHIFDLIKTVKAMGVDHVTVTDLNTEGIDLEARLRDDSRIADQILLNFMPEEEVWEIIRQIKSYEDANFEVVVPGQYGGLKGSAKAGTAILTCEELWELPFVTCDGYVIPCCWASHPSIFNMGNISEHRFEDIWFGSPYRRLRFQHIMNQHPTYCLRCQQLVWTIAEQSKFRGQSRSEHCHRRCFLNLRSRMRLAQETPKRFP